MRSNLKNDQERRRETKWLSAKLEQSIVSIWENLPVLARHRFSYVRPSDLKERLNCYQFTCPSDIAVTPAGGYIVQIVSNVGLGDFSFFNFAPLMQKGNQSLFYIKPLASLKHHSHLLNKTDKCAIFNNSCP
jgi:hypothetical protein